MNYKQRKSRLKRMFAQNKLYRKTGFWSVKAQANQSVRDYRSEEYKEESDA